jgi:AhpD family alkylhydroperoxidase
VTPAKSPRLEPLPLSDWTDEEFDLLRGNLARADRYLSGDPDAPPPPAILGLFALHPKVAGPWLGFNGSLLQEGALVARDRELIILRVAARTRCVYEWEQHWSMGASAGLTMNELAAVVDNDAIAIWSDRDRDLLLAVDQLLSEHTLDDDLWAQLAAHFDKRQLLEICFVVGSYACLAMVLNSAGLIPTVSDSSPTRTQE